MKELVKNLWEKATQPASLVALVGIAGFCADYFWRPISNAGLILLGFVIAPFLIRLVKKISLSGVDLELLPQASEPEQKEKLERETRESTEEKTTSLPTKVGKPTEVALAPDPSLTDRYIADEALIIREISARVGGFLKREVKLGKRIFDAVVSSRLETEIIEIKIFYQKFLTLQNLDETVRQIGEAREYLQRRSSLTPVKARLIVGLDVDEGEILTKARERIKIIQDSRPDVAIELILLPTLRKRWGSS